LFTITLPQLISVSILGLRYAALHFFQDANITPGRSLGIVVRTEHVPDRNGFLLGPLTFEVQFHRAQRSFSLPQGLLHLGKVPTNS